MDYIGIVNLSAEATMIDRILDVKDSTSYRERNGAVRIWLQSWFHHVSWLPWCEHDMKYFGIEHWISWCVFQCTNNPENDKIFPYRLSSLIVDMTHVLIRTTQLLLWFHMSKSNLFCMQIKQMISSMYLHKLYELFHHQVTCYHFKPNLFWTELRMW